MYPNFYVMPGLLDCKFVSVHIFICILIFLLGMYIKLLISVCMSNSNVNLMYLNHSTFKLIIFLVQIKKEQVQERKQLIMFLLHGRILESQKFNLVLSILMIF